MKILPRIFSCLFLLAGISICFFDNTKIAQVKRKLQNFNQSPEDPSIAYQSLKVPVSIYELSSPVDYATQNPGQVNQSPGLINISPMNHDSNYLKIASELKSYEDAYSACINSLTDVDFSDDSVDACVGINYNYVYDDIDYEKSKILARGDSVIRDFMIQNCYTVAGVDLVLSNACDLVEKDVISLLWNELNYAALLDYHRNKYMFEHSFMNETIFNTILAEFQLIQNETSSLMVELYDHRQLTLDNLERLISTRTSEILKKYHQSGNDGGMGSQSNMISIDVNGLDNGNEYYNIHGNEKYLDYAPWQHGGNNDYRSSKNQIKQNRGLNRSPHSRSLELNEKEGGLDRGNKIELGVETVEEKTVESKADETVEKQVKELLSGKE